MHMYMLSMKTLHVQNARLSLFLSEELEKYGIFFHPQIVWLLQALDAFIGFHSLF